ncbi:ribosomal protein L21-like protein [Bombardia bombarda]|uniref:Large ribosomal subunit protein bL21m n=1 Tax=Bombardia bombarda TaxID=252184 RepID=A0AA39X705_9PEZI|nr:ribosomal protein L21-like protein [Bombardia bombarda]
MSRALLRSVLELRTPITRLPPSFLLPIRTAAVANTASSARFFNTTTQIIEPGVPPASASEVDSPGHYLTVHIHGKPYLVTEGDSVRLPFKMPGVEPGDVLRLNRAAVVGSRDFTLQGTPYVDERLFACRATVVGTEAEPMRVLIKKKRRTRRKKHVFSKHRHTILRISEVRIKDVGEIEA